MTTALKWLIDNVQMMRRNLNKLRYNVKDAEEKLRIAKITLEEETEIVNMLEKHAVDLGGELPAWPSGCD